jgi:hypothetical protein
MTRILLVLGAACIVAGVLAVSPHVQIVDTAHLASTATGGNITTGPCPGFNQQLGLKTNLDTFVVGRPFNLQVVVQVPAGVTIESNSCIRTELSISVNGIVWLNHTVIPEFTHNDFCNLRPVAQVGCPIVGPTTLHLNATVETSCTEFWLALALHACSKVHTTCKVDGTFKLRNPTPGINKTCDQQDGDDLTCLEVNTGGIPNQCP